MNKTKFLEHANPLILKGVAHRGLHNDKFTENGLKAFENAINHNVAFELDVHASKDGVLIVCHDPDLKRTTGKEGIIEELTLEEIKRDYRLLDGEEVPTFQEVLKLCGERVPIFVELKVENKNYKYLSSLLIKEMANIKDKKNFVIISFDPRALFGVKKLGIMRQLLLVDHHEWVGMYKCFFEGLDIQAKLLKMKKYQRYAKRHFMNVWTIESTEQLNEVIEYVDTATFQYVEPKEIEKILKK